MKDNRRHHNKPLRLAPGTGRPEPAQPEGFPPSLPRPGVKEEVWPEGPAPDGDHIKRFRRKQ
jgi:hypothetical protein